MTMLQKIWTPLFLSFLSVFVFSQTTQAADVSLLNVSYDPTRELYQDFNAAFAKKWKEKNNQNVTVKQ